jgi:hypothetical protein
MEERLAAVGQKSEGNTSEIVQAALKCIAFVMRRARELPPEEQEPMLSMVQKFISIEGDRESLRA